MNIGRLFWLVDFFLEKQIHLARIALSLSLWGSTTALKDLKLREIHHPNSTHHSGLQLSSPHPLVEINFTGTSFSTRRSTTFVEEDHDNLNQPKRASSETRCTAESHPWLGVLASSLCDHHTTSATPYLLTTRQRSLECRGYATY